MCIYVLCMYVSMYVSMYVCMYVCMYVYVCMYMSLCTYVYVCMSACVSVCMCVSCRYVDMHAGSPKTLPAWLIRWRMGRKARGRFPCRRTGSPSDAVCLRHAHFMTMFGGLAQRPI